MMRIHKSILMMKTLSWVHTYISLYYTYTHILRIYYIRVYMENYGCVVPKLAQYMYRICHMCICTCTCVLAACVCVCGFCLIWPSVMQVSSVNVRINHYFSSPLPFSLSLSAIQPQVRRRQSHNLTHSMNLTSRNSSRLEIFTSLLISLSLSHQRLLRWINDVLETRRLIIRDIVEDLYDGQVLGELIGIYMYMLVYVGVV